ncbi:CorA metal ion transporter [Actinomortierella wolfii]|nr:CorA metal ion transporter [Actinomortierella wolfii]
MDNDTSPRFPVHSKKQHASSPSPSVSQTPGSLSQLSRSIHSVKDADFEYPGLHDEQLHEDHGDDSDHETSGRHVSVAHLLDPSRSSYSYSLPQSLGSNNYSQESLSGSPLLYGDSFVDRQHMHKQYQDYHLQQQQSQRQQSQSEQVHTPPNGNNEQSQIKTQQRPKAASRHSSSHTDTTERGGVSRHPSGASFKSLLGMPDPSSTSRTTNTSSTSPPMRPSGSAGSILPDRQSRPSPTGSKSSKLSQSRRQHEGYGSLPLRYHSGAETSPSLSESSSRSGSVGEQDAHDHGQDITTSTLIMPQITTTMVGSIRSDHPNDDLDHVNYRSISPEILREPTERDHLLARTSSTSPVPMHARLMKLQKEARRGAHVVDMENGSQSRHYDIGDMTDSSYDFTSSRRHSIVDDDVCYPFQSQSLDVDYEALEEYISEEQTRLQQQAGNKKIHPGRPKSHTERSYSLFGERDRSQVPLDDTYRFTLYTTSSVTIHAQTLGEIPAKGQTLSSMLQAGYFWLDVLAPTDDEVKMLSRVFGVHPLTTEDILQEEGREKCEMFLNYYFVCFRTFVLDQSNLSDVQALSYHFRPVLHCRNVRKRIRHLKNRVEVTPDWINYALIDDIVDSFAPLIRQVETEVDMIDELVLILKESERTDMLRRIGNCRKRVMSLLRLLTGKADVIKGLIKRYEGRVGRKNTGEIGLFMGDIQDHIITMLQNLSHYEKILARSHSNYLAQINIEMTSASNETNDVLAKLTALGSILLPMNLVTGLWGMNVPVPGQESEGLAWFFWIVTAIFLAATLFLYIARKLRLL